MILMSGPFCVRIFEVNVSCFGPCLDGELCYPLGVLGTNVGT